ncbi:MAG: DUF885 domain-containing protein [Pseudomonadota bacterium]
MKVLIGCLILSLASTAVADADSDAFDTLTQTYLNDVGTLSPVAATQTGDHTYDHLLDDVSDTARNATLDALLGYRAALADIDRESLSPALQVDYELLSNQVEFDIWTLGELEPWAWNPMYYVSISGNSIYTLVARNFAPLEERLNNAAARMQQMPRFFEQARASLVPERVPKVYAETAVKQNRGLVSIIKYMIEPELGSVSAATRDNVLASIDIAKAAVEEHQAWLENELLPRASAEFRVGASVYDRKLAFALNSDLGRKEIRARAESEYERVRNEMYEISKGVYKELHPYTAFPDRPDEAYKQTIIRAALEQAYQNLPPEDGIVDLARKQLAAATAFVIERNLVTMPQEPVEIIVMPEFRRGFSFAYLDPPGPLDSDQPAFYAVSPLPSAWNKTQIRSFLREYNVYSMEDLTIHEGVPGHYLQLALSNRYPSTLRAVLYSGSFVEGWAVYAEQFMIEEGYLDYDPLMRLINLKWYLRAITNAIIDSAIHVDGMTEDEAMHLMIEGGFQEEREAAGKWTRAQLSFGQLSTYFVGYQEHIELRADVEAAWDDEFTLRRYHDQVLSYGSPPVRFVRALMFGDAIPRSVK